MNDGIAAASAPDWPTAHGAIPANRRDFRDNPHLHPLAAIVWTSVDSAITCHFRCKAEMSLAAVALAMRRYLLEHENKLPSGLPDLVPGYLREVPADPMTTGRPLMYVSGNEPNSAHAGDPIIYSVGENSVDDGGSEEPARSWTPDPISPLDIVFHLRQMPRTRENPDDDGAPERRASEK
jgi:hypothetical protein